MEYIRPLQPIMLLDEFGLDFSTDSNQSTYETPIVVSSGIPQFTYETPIVVSSGITQFR